MHLDQRYNPVAHVVAVIDTIQRCLHHVEGGAAGKADDPRRACRRLATRRRRAGPGFSSTRRAETRRNPNAWSAGGLAVADGHRIVRPVAVVGDVQAIEELIGVLEPVPDSGRERIRGATEQAILPRAVEVALVALAAVGVVAEQFGSGGHFNRVELPPASVYLERGRWIVPADGASWWGDRRSSPRPGTGSTPVTTVASPFHGAQGVHAPVAVELAVAVAIVVAAARVDPVGCLA